MVTRLTRLPAGALAQAGATVVIASLACAGAGCRKTVVEPLVLEGAQLQINNETGETWQSVELWLNRYFRATVHDIPAHSRYKVPLDAFVSGYAQRFDFSHMQITALRLTAKHPDGTPFELNKQFEEGGLAGALGGKR
jgi:hypothetical protein